MLQIKKFSNKKLIYSLLITSVVLKLFFLYILGAQPFLDGKWYIKAAITIFENNFVFPDNYLDDLPLTPYFYAFFYPFYQLFGINGFAFGNIILSSLLILIVYKSIHLVSNNNKIALIAAIITTFYPFFNFYAIALLSETLFIFLVYFGLYFLLKFLKNFKTIDIAIFSFLFALSALTRSVSLPAFFVIIFFVAFLLLFNKKSYLFVLKSIFVSTFVFFLTFSPWLVRNYHISKEIVFSTPNPNADFGFYIGNNPLNKTGGGIKGDFNIDKYLKIKDQNLAAQMAFDDAIKWIKENPKDWIVLEYKKFIRFFRITPFDKHYQSFKYKITSILSYGVVLLFFVLSIFSCPKVFLRFFPHLLFSLSLTGVHMLFFASIRYRLPIEPFMIIIASFAIHRIIYKNETYCS